MASSQERSVGVEVFGISENDLYSFQRVAVPERYYGNIKDFSKGIAIGIGIAKELGVFVGDKIKLISPDGVQTAFGTIPRVSVYEIVYIFQVGRYDIDRTRLYMPFHEAQTFFGVEGFADEIEIKSLSNQLIFSCSGQFAEQETIMGSSSTGLTFLQNNENNIIQGVYALKHLVLFSKCTNLCNCVELYLKNDFPLIIKYTIASLGEIKLCLAPKYSN